jgi:hypothetical protein
MRFDKDRLTIAQRLLWPLLNELPEGFVLYGGTAAGLRFGHRVSADFDFFSNSFDPGSLRRTVMGIPFVDRHLDALNNIEARNQIDLIVRVKDPSIELEKDNFVKFTFVSDRDLVPGCIEEPDESDDNGVRVASPIDLFCNKILATATREKREDFADIVQFLRQGYSLEEALKGCFSIVQRSPLYSEISLDNVLEALRGEKSLRALKNDASARSVLAEACRQVDMGKVYGSKVALHERLFDVHRPSPGPEPGDGPGAGPEGKKKTLCLEDYKAKLVWNRNADLLNDTTQFLAFVLAMRPVCYYELVDHYGFTDDDFVRALKHAPRGLFLEEETWRRWHQYFGVEPVPPLPSALNFTRARMSGRGPSAPLRRAGPDAP